jgi:hypothetical protein
MDLDRHQILITQQGAEVFAFDTIQWPPEVFPYPIVYTAWAMTEDSYDSKRLGWKWIRREQFEWLVRHSGCLVSYLVVDNMPFYCNKHKCWEKNGIDYSLTEQLVEQEEDLRVVSLDSYEERVV